MSLSIFNTNINQISYNVHRKTPQFSSLKMVCFVQLYNSRQTAVHTMLAAIAPAANASPSLPIAALFRLRVLRPANSHWQCGTLHAPHRCAAHHNPAPERSPVQTHRIHRAARLRPDGSHLLPFRNSLPPAAVLPKRAKINLVRRKSAIYAQFLARPHGYRQSKAHPEWDGLKRQIRLPVRLFAPAALPALRRRGPADGRPCASAPADGCRSPG